MNTSVSAEERRFVDTVLSNPINAAIVERLHQLDVPDCWLVSGSLFQTVWNVQTGSDVAYGIKDYDIFYFDSADMSWEAEDKVIQRSISIFSDLAADVQVRNQARVHLWYEQKFGASYPPLSSSCDGIDRFTTPSSMYGLGVQNNGQHQVYAPFGFSDPFDLVVRPNPASAAVAHVYEEKSKRWKQMWPELKVISFEDIGAATVR